MSTLNTASPSKFSGMRKFVRTFVIIVLLLLGVFIYWKYFYVFAVGVKSGYLNFAVKKGQVFKTYEGKLIQEGIRSRTAGAIQSNEFEFSVKSKRIFDTLSLNSGKIFDLQYREYNGVVPWRGNTRYVVDSIISMRNPDR